MRLPDKNILSGKYWTHSVTMVSGCSRVSPGCDHCWALALEQRVGTFAPPKFQSDRLARLVAGRAPRVVSIWNDLFHEVVTTSDLAQVFTHCEMRLDHTYLILTKRAGRMHLLLSRYMPSKNVWLGVTAENQEQVDARISLLREANTWHRFVSIEPILGPVDLSEHLTELDWVIVGAETGQDSRIDDMTNTHILSVINQCREADVSVWVKANGTKVRGRWCPSTKIDKWPRCMCFRQLPVVEPTYSEPVGISESLLFDDME